jgi:hypothetical protein
MADSQPPNDINPKKEIAARRSEKDKKLLIKKMERWIDDNLNPHPFYPEITELLIRKFVQKFGKQNEHAKLIQSELKKLRPKGRPVEIDNVKLKVIESYYEMTKAAHKDWNHQQCLESVAKGLGYEGTESWKTIQEYVTKARKL